MNNGKWLLNIGNSTHSQAKKLIYLAPVGLVLLLITMLCCGEYAAEYLALHGVYPIVNVLVFCWYLFIVIGISAVFPYYLGLILIGIGQITINTSNEEPSESELTYAKIRNATAGAKRPVESKPIVTPSALSADKVEKAKRSENWICSSCGKENINGFNYCEKCGMPK